MANPTAVAFQPPAGLLATPLVESAQSLVITRVWSQWLTALGLGLQGAPHILNPSGPTILTAQSASISPTQIPVGSIPFSLVRVSWFVRVTTAATTSSSVQVAIGFTTGGVACQISGAALTGNSTTTVQSGSVVVPLDPSSPLTYQVAYVSVGATPMQYSLYLLVEGLG